MANCQRHPNYRYYAHQGEGEPLTFDDLDLFFEDVRRIRRKEGRVQDHDPAADEPPPQWAHLLTQEVLAQRQQDYPRDDRHEHPDAGSDPAGLEGVIQEECGAEEQDDNARQCQPPLTRGRFKAGPVGLSRRGSRCGQGGRRRLGCWSLIHWFDNRFGGWFGRLGRFDRLNFVGGDYGPRELLRPRRCGRRGRRGERFRGRCSGDLRDFGRRFALDSRRVVSFEQR